MVALVPPATDPTTADAPNIGATVTMVRITASDNDSLNLLRDMA
jgi:hypothetical protein